ncbi:pyridoxamine 5'-phosphate oxidase family protein [Roseomonas gilardii]|uniref:pyridoxamine 5'-phosphate oxidase family protein n=1 Tax=Roseomonas gilardii TaxID=257708 RepID=UPI0011A655C9|nr:pyridoxamine 5'-phosphate oxidase family protein [Roseomonas gilardii]
MNQTSSGMSLSDLSRLMRKIDYCMFSTHAGNGHIAGRPMSNNGDVEYAGDSWFFALDSTRTVQEIGRDPKVALSFASSQGLLGQRPLFIAVEGEAELIRDKDAFQEHWNKDLDRWFEQGVDTPGLTLIRVQASRITYWDGMEEGEVSV